LVEREDSRRDTSERRDALERENHALLSEKFALQSEKSDLDRQVAVLEHDNAAKRQTISSLELASTSVQAEKQLVVQEKHVLEVRVSVLEERGTHTGRRIQELEESSARLQADKEMALQQKSELQIKVASLEDRSIHNDIRIQELEQSNESLLAEKAVIERSHQAEIQSIRQIIKLEMQVCSLEQRRLDDLEQRTAAHGTVWWLQMSCGCLAVLALAFVALGGCLFVWLHMQNRIDCQSNHAALTSCSQTLNSTELSLEMARLTIKQYETELQWLLKKNQSNQADLTRCWQTLNSTEASLQAMQLTMKQYETERVRCKALPKTEVCLQSSQSSSRSPIGWFDLYALFLVIVTCVFGIFVWEFLRQHFFSDARAFHGSDVSPQVHSVDTDSNIASCTSCIGEDAEAEDFQLMYTREANSPSAVVDDLWAEHEDGSEIVLSDTGLSQDSVLSAGSWALAGGSGCGRPCCFLPGTLFIMDDQMVQVSNLERGSVLTGPRGDVKVVQIIRHPETPRSIVRLDTDGLQIEVTSDHRLMAQTETGPKTLAAGDISSEALLCCWPGDLPVRVTRTEITTPVFEMTFSNDDPVYMRMNLPPPFAIVKGKPQVPVSALDFIEFKFKGQICKKLKHVGIEQWLADNEIDACALGLRFDDSRPYAFRVPREHDQVVYNRISEKLQAEAASTGTSVSKIYRHQVVDDEDGTLLSTPQPLTP